MSIKKASEDDLSHIVELHNKMYPGDTFTGVVLSFVLMGGNTYVATLNKKIIGYVCVHKLLKQQLNTALAKFLKTFADEKLHGGHNPNDDNNPFFIIPLTGIIDEHKVLLPKLIDKAIKHCTKKDYFRAKHLVVFVRKNDIESQNIYMSKGFLFTSFVESNMFSNPKDDGVLMHKKISIMNNILTKF